MSTLRGHQSWHWAATHGERSTPKTPLAVPGTAWTGDTQPHTPLPSHPPGSLEEAPTAVWRSEGTGRAPFCHPRVWGAFMYLCSKGELGGSGRRGGRKKRGVLGGRCSLPSPHGGEPRAVSWSWGREEGHQPALHLRAPPLLPPARVGGLNTCQGPAALTASSSSSSGREKFGLGCTSWCSGCFHALAALTRGIKSSLTVEALFPLCGIPGWDFRWTCPGHPSRDKCT